MDTDNRHDLSVGSIVRTVDNSGILLAPHRLYVSIQSVNNSTSNQLARNVATNYYESREETTED